MPPRRTPRIINFVHGGTTYQLPIDGEIQIRAVNDSPPFVPTTGAQSAKSRQYHNIASIRNIKNAFALLNERNFETTGGVISNLFSAEAETRFNSGIWFPSFENNPTMPAGDTGSSRSIIMPPTTGLTTRPSAITGPNRNPKAAIFFAGTTNSGVFTGRVDDVANGGGVSDDYNIDVLRWTGTAWTEEDNLVDASTTEARFAPLDFVVHKGALTVLYGDGSAEVASSADGNSFTNFTNDPSAETAAGGRLLDDGNTLFHFRNSQSNVLGIEHTSDAGDSAWVSGLTNAEGPLRDVDRFFDRDGTSRIMVLTETSLYWLDISDLSAGDLVLNHLMTLPASGRAMMEWNGELIIFMDNNKVIAYQASGAMRDITPSNAFPFGIDVDGQVCVTRGTRGIYALWSGADISGTDRAPLCLMWDGVGWHFIWQKGAAAISGAARFVVIDPQSGDLLMAVQAALSENTTLVQLKNIEDDPEDHAAQDRALAMTLTTPRLDFGVPMVPTTVWDIFNHTNGLDANETIKKEYRIDGSTGSYSEIAEVAADNTLTTLASGVGVNARDFQFKFTGSLNAKTDKAQIFALDVGYAKLWPVRLMYSFTVRTDFNIPGGRSAQQIRLDITTIMGVQTKGTLNLGGDAASDSATVIPIPETTASEIIGNLSDPNGAKRASTWTLHMLEA